ncbi:MAG: type II toxin-antitoxin system VapC family toxin [Candidatus Bathyarchaeia archaeon]
MRKGAWGRTPPGGEGVRRYVIDAGILFLHFIDDEGVRPYLDEIIQGKAQAFISDVNLAEYYYKTCEKLGKGIADLRYHQIRDSDIISVATDETLTLKAGEKKCRYRGTLSLADCFALALSELKEAILLTTDSELAKVREVSVKHFSV